jgi:streptomycin 6-kinase
VELLDLEQHRRLTTYHAGAEEWIQRLPGLVDHYASRWQLTIGPTYRPGGDASWAAQAERADGTAAVLKIALPDPAFFDHAAEALRRYDGQGAIRLYELDAEHQASLYERCDPGTTAANHSLDEADTAAVAVLPSLWRASRMDAAPLLSDTANGQIDRLRARGDEFSEPLFHQGADLVTELAIETQDDRLLHGDFNQRNVLLSARGWLAIDPRPIFGDPTFDLGQWLVNRLDADPDPIDRARRLATRLDLYPQRTVQWLAALSIQLCSWLWQSDETGQLADYERNARLLLAAS